MTAWMSFISYIDWIFLAVFALIFILFLLEFKVTSKQSWIVLLGFFALGAYLGFQGWRRKKLLQLLEQREKELENLEREYESLKAEGKLTEAAYREARAELERAKVEAGLAILRADERYRETVKAIEREYQNLGPEESLKKIREALQSN
ncbi:MAG: hypothetical protein GXO78_04100 [Calditrichaeota bacterium]|nr:hypothetical protein [Calditrichota bacterium]